MLQATLGVLSGVIGVIGMVPYIRDILLRKTKPERATWWIWLSLNFVAFAAQWAAGATWSLGMTVGQIIALLLIASLSIPYGYGTFSLKHIISLVVAAFGIILWRLTDEPVLALVIVVIVDFLAFWLTIRKTWRAPDTETLSAWVFATVAAAFGALAVASFDAVKLMYPLYITFGNLALVAIIILRRRTQAREKQY